MNVLAESNFLLEIALRQPDALHALRIVEWAEQKKIRLVMPAYSFAEPLHKLGKAKSERRALQDRLETELGEISRSSDFADVRDRSKLLMAALAEKSDADKREFDSITQRLLRCVEVIPLTSQHISAGLSRQLIDLGPQDALMFAAAEEFLRSNPGQESVFVNKNAKDFFTETVSKSLADLGCKLLVKFSDARSYIENELEKKAKLES